MTAHYSTPEIEPSQEFEKLAKDAGWFKCIGGEFTKIVNGLQYVAADAEDAINIDRWLAEKRERGEI